MSNMEPDEGNQAEAPRLDKLQAAGEADAPRLDEADAPRLDEADAPRLDEADAPRLDADEGTSRSDAPRLD